MNVEEVFREEEVASVYQKSEVVNDYINKRFIFSWSKLLHKRQVQEINRLLKKTKPKNVLEIAPGPARIATELENIQKGTMLEWSEGMIGDAEKRLLAVDKLKFWDILHGNAFEASKLEKKYDFIYTFRFIRHFKIEDRERLYKEISGCLAKDGIFVFDVVNVSVRTKIGQENHQKANQVLVYDELYTTSLFSQEMAKFGFEVVCFIPVIKYFFLQGWFSHKFDHRCKLFSRFVVNLLEYLPSRQPLEWIAICRKIA